MLRSIIGYWHCSKSDTAKTISVSRLDNSNLQAKPRPYNRESHVGAVMSQTATIELQARGTYQHATSSGLRATGSTLSIQRSIDTHQLDDQQDHSETQTSSEETSLPPVDRGKAAWLFLAACWLVEAMTFGESLGCPCNCHSLAVGCVHRRDRHKAWLTYKHTGFGFSFGIFQDYYSTHEPFAGSSGIAAIGTTTSVSPLVSLVAGTTRELTSSPSR